MHEMAPIEMNVFCQVTRISWTNDNIGNMAYSGITPYSE